MAKNILRLQYLPSPGVRYDFDTGIDSLNVTTNMQWDSQSVYGRRDPIQTYKSSDDSFSLAWPVNSPDKVLLDNLKYMRRMMTRAFYDGGVIKEAPLWRVTFPFGAEIPWIDVYCAPTNISFDFGDRARKEEQVIRDTGGSFGVIGEARLLPQKILVTLSANVIGLPPGKRNNKKKNTPVDNTDSPQPILDGETANILGS